MEPEVAELGLNGVRTDGSTDALMRVGRRTDARLDAREAALTA